MSDGANECQSDGHQDKECIAVNPIEDPKPTPIPDEDFVQFFEAVSAGDFDTISKLFSKHDQNVKYTFIMPSASEPTGEPPMNIHTLCPKIFASVTEEDLNKFKQFGDPDKAVTKSGFFKDLSPQKLQYIVVSM